MFRKTHCDHGYKGISKDGIKILITVAYATAIIRLHTVQWVGDELFLSIINELLSNLSNVEDFSDETLSTPTIFQVNISKFVRDSMALYNTIWTQTNDVPRYVHTECTYFAVCTNLDSKNLS